MLVRDLFTTDSGSLTVHLPSIALIHTDGSGTTLVVSGAVLRIALDSSESKALMWAWSCHKAANRC